MRILQFTDPHLYGRIDGKLRGVQTDASLRAVLQTAFAQCPDYEAVVVSGDLVQDDPAGYIRFRSIFAHLQKPVLCVPGNHDIPHAMHAELVGAPFQICGTWQSRGWQIILLDSYEAGRVGGRLSDAELARLDAALGASPAHTLICLHHHPVLMRSRWLDGIGLANVDEFWRVLDMHSHVRAVTWGHVHQEFEGRRGAVRLFATPSTGAQFLPLSETFAIDTRPPAFRQFELTPSGEIHTQIHWVAAPAVRRTAS